MIPKCTLELLVKMSRVGGGIFIEHFVKFDELLIDVFKKSRVVASEDIFLDFVIKFSEIFLENEGTSCFLQGLSGRATFTNELDKLQGHFPFLI